MRLIGTAVAVAAAIMLVTAGTADAKKRHHRGPGAFKFCVQCPVISPVPWTRSTCSAKGKTRDAARASCQTQNQFCYIRNYSPKTCK